MLLKGEFRKDPHGLSDLLLWDNFVADGILQLADGSLQATWSYEGLDLESLSAIDRRQLADQCARILNLGGRWMVETNAMRREVRGYFPPSDWAHPVARTIDWERARQFHEPRIFFRTFRHITLTYLPPPRGEQRLARWLSGQEQAKECIEQARLYQEQNRKYFLEKVAGFEGGLAALVKCRRLRTEMAEGPDGDPIEDNQVLRYLRECAFGEDHTFPEPTLKISINRLFRRELLTGSAPIVGDKHLRVLAIDTFPHGSWPGMFRKLENIQLPYRWHTRMLLMDPLSSAKMHEKNQRIWRGSERGIAAQLFNTPGKISGDAVNMKANAFEATTRASEAKYLFGMWNAKMILMSESLDDIQQWRTEVEQAIKPLGFGLRLETGNTIDSWRGSLPGHGYSDVRVHPVTTQNLADAIPLSMPFTGFRENPSPHMPPNTPALFLAATDGNTPYYFNQHTGQVIHVDGKPEAEVLHGLLFGPTRGGKSFKLAYTVLSWLTRYQNAQVFAFDKKFSMRNLAWALDGRHYPFGGNQEQLQLAPLSDIDTEEDLAWAANWLETLCVMRSLTLTPAEANDLNGALRRLSARPRNRRSITELLVTLRNQRLVDALQYYSGSSAASGGLLDGQEDALGDESFCCFEMEYLMQMDRRILRAVMLYLFRSIGKRLDSRRPTLIPIDESWIVFDDEYFAGFLRSWLKELAKLNAGVILATQNLTDFIGTPLEQVVIDQCATRIYVPTPSAKHGAKADFLKLGLNQQQIARIAEGVMKRDYFVQSPYGFQRFQLHAGEVLKAFIGRNGSADRERIAHLRAIDPTTWQVRWLRDCGLAEWATYLEQLFEEEGSEEKWQVLSSST